MCSRREADRYIEAGLVSVDGEVIDVLGTKIDPGAVVTLDERAERKQEALVTILLNKPLGIVSAQAEDGHTPAITLLTPENQDPEFATGRLQQSHFQGLAVAGRLDINSKGLLVFTQDGRVARKLIGEGGMVEKEYLVRVERLPDEEELELLRHGLTLDEVELRPAVVEILNDNQLRFILRQGRKRQIRRMCEAVGIEVAALKRVRVGKVPLGKLAEGQWRFLAPGEQF